MSACAWLRGLPRPVFIPATDERVLVMGRAERTPSNALRLGYPGVTLRLSFKGRWLALRASSEKTNRFALLIDGKAARTITLESGLKDRLLASDLPDDDREHELELVRLNETWQGVVTIHGFVLENRARLLPTRPFPPRRILFIGDSITCGEAIDRTPECRGRAVDLANADASYAMLLARDLGAQAELVCYGGRGMTRDWQGRRDVLNAPRFFELSVPERTARRHDLRAFPADAVFIALGTNDAVTLEESESAEFIATYVRFLQRIRAVHPVAPIFLTEGPMLNDLDPKRPLKTRFQRYLAEVAARARDPRVHVIPSKHYPGDACNTHPTRREHAELARDYAPILRAALGW